MKCQDSDTYFGIQTKRNDKVNHHWSWGTPEGATGTTDQQLITTDYTLTVEGFESPMYY